MPAYYNDFDPYCGEWLKNLIAAGRIPPGDVDDRPIQKVHPDDLKGYDQVHMFAGIGGFGLAARMAGWPDDLPLWTGGFPCQPFSEAGDQKAEEDERALWPELYRLIRARRPDRFLGENVRGIIDLGLDRVLDDLEKADYTTRPYRIGAFAVNAPHRRERVWMVALANTIGERRHGEQDFTGRDNDNRTATQRNEGSSGVAVAVPGIDSPWADASVVVGPDQKRRRFAAGICPLGDGVPNRMDILKGYGNAICPQVAGVILNALYKALP